jgi:hypothetical protein
MHCISTLTNVKHFKIISLQEIRRNLFQFLKKANNMITICCDITPFSLADTNIPLASLVPIFRVDKNSVFL